MRGISKIVDLRKGEGAASVVLALAVFGCGGDLASSDAVAQLSVPSRSDFPPVADAMQLHCGTLDCHGQVGRNMRLYGQYGLRLGPKDDPLTEPTSDAEYDASYASIVGLEPEVESNVFLQKAEPELLTMVRKARGIEKHKGGQLVTAGDALDTCMVGWLTGAPNANACSTVTSTPRPEPPKISPDGG
jgi:hypothetical protein